MILLQLSAAQGPSECCLAVSRALRRLLHEAALCGVQIEIIGEEGGERAGTLRSVLVSLEGEPAPDLARQWEGTVQWTCQTPLPAPACAQELVYRRGALCCAVTSPGGRDPL